MNKTISDYKQTQSRHTSVLSDGIQSNASIDLELVNTLIHLDDCLEDTVKATNERCTFNAPSNESLIDSFHL